MKPRHSWGQAQFNTEGQRYWRCTHHGCSVWKDSHQLLHGAWETRYHLPGGMVMVGRAPACMGLAPVSQKTLTARKAA